MTILINSKKKTNKTFLKTTACDLARISFDIYSNLDKYQITQMDIFTDLSEKINENLIKLKKLELNRIDNFIKSGIN